MSPITPKTFRGTRDFLPEVMVARSDLIDRIRKSFELYGFSPLETPAIEYLETLKGKYGDEVEKLLYKLAYKGGEVLALRYDLTIPLARVAAQNPNLPKPFKRYQIQPVWRADRPQIKQGRFREFSQCDVDIVGSDSLAADAEILALTVETLNRLEIGPFTVRVNHRELLAAIIRAAGIADDSLITASRCLDKWDKIGAAGVRAEMESEGFDSKEINTLLSLVDEDPTSSSLERMDKLAPSVKKSGGSESLEIMKEVFQLLDSLGVDTQRIAFWPSLARGLDYYTGTVFETFHDELPHMGSLTGGGRYDNLIGIFLGAQIPATGTTIGIDRILSALQQTNRLQLAPSKTQIFVAVFDKDSMQNACRLASLVRNAGYRTEIAYSAQKLKKQFTRADRQGIPVVLIQGPDEKAGQVISVKQLESGDQVKIPEAGLIEYLASIL